MCIRDRSAPRRRDLSVGEAPPCEAWRWYAGWDRYWPSWDCTFLHPWCCESHYLYEAGTLLLDLLEPVDVDSDGAVELVSRWTAGLNGVLASSAASNRIRIETGLVQAFEQSPYLRAGAGKGTR